MLVQFSVANFRSIKERQTLDLTAAAKDRELIDNLLPEDATTALGGVRLLRSAIVYGANASGKSNLLSAIVALRNLVVHSAAQFRPDQATGAVPFSLDVVTRTKPSAFTVVFLLDGIRHEYRVQVDARVVHGEELIHFPKGRPALVYARQRQADGTYVFKGGSAWKGGDELHAKTRPNALMLSVGAQFNHDLLMRVYTWFAKQLHYWDLSTLQEAAYPLLLTRTSQLVHGDAEARRSIESLLAQADLGIAGLRTRAITPEELLLPPGVPDVIGETLRSEATAGRLVDTRCLHRVAGSDELAEFAISEESAGTQRFFSLLGPLRQILADGACLAIDELDASLHPLLARAVIALLHDPQVNKNNAQIIVTMHDTTLMNQEIIRRDQIWFTEKDPDGGTRLFPLTDYKPKQGEALQRGYLGGRYGGVPILPTRMEV